MRLLHKGPPKPQLHTGKYYGADALGLECEGSRGESDRFLQLLGNDFAALFRQVCTSRMGERAGSRVCGARNCNKTQH